MELPEQADSSAESIIRPNVIDRLDNERAVAGSTLHYVRELGQWYEGQGDHLPNLYQLQRMAGMITNPTNEPSFPKTLMNAFYWGEILAYRAQDLLSEDEGDWAEHSYPLFSKAMINYAEEAALLFESPEKDPITGEWDAPELNHNERLQGIADMIMQELEDETSEYMPRAMEDFIVGVSEELSERMEDRWYMILGFRHITMMIQKKAEDAELESVAEKATEAEDIERVKELKREQRVKRRLEKKFLKLMDINEIDDIQGRELVPIDDVREQIMESYADHTIAYGPYDMTDEESIDRLGMYLTHAMNRDFSDIENIEDDDFLQVGGNAVFIIYNEDEQSQVVHILGPNEFLKGSAQAVAIVETPSAEAMMRLQERLIDADELQQDKNPLGVVLILKDPVIVNSDKEHIQVGGNRVVGVIMSNPDMHMSKHLF